MNLPSAETITSLHHKYAPSDQAFQIIFNHCRIVAEIADELIAKNNLEVDQALVHAGALLHDIDAYQLINAAGELAPDYIRHGVAGAAILRAEELPEALGRIAERHTGVGIMRDQIIRRSLPMPPADYNAETAEERLIMYADKFHSKRGRGNPERFNSLASYKTHVSKFDPANGAKFQAMIDEYGEPDIAALATKYHLPVH